MAKKYYWLKLQRDFFKRHDIRIIEDMPNGKDYILFYMKLLVESIDHEGQLRFSETIPYNDNMLATITNTNIDIVRSAVKIFNELDLMNIMDDGTLYLSETSNMLGSVTDWAEKKKAYREKQKQLGQKEDMSDKSKSKSIELEKELDLEIEKDNIPYSEIILRLNQSCETSFRSSSQKTKSLIKARFAEGFTLEDFYTVIIKKSKEWQGTEYSQYLRPETLFSTKFEGYLNQKINKKPDQMNMGTGRDIEGFC